MLVKYPPFPYNGYTPLARSRAPIPCSSPCLPAPYTLSANISRSIELSESNLRYARVNRSLSIFVRRQWLKTLSQSQRKSVNEGRTGFVTPFPPALSTIDPTPPLVSFASRYAASTASNALFLFENWGGFFLGFIATFRFKDQTGKATR